MTCQLLVAILQQHLLYISRNCQKTNINAIVIMKFITKLALLLFICRTDGQIMGIGKWNYINKSQVANHYIKNVIVPSAH